MTTEPRIWIRFATLTDGTWVAVAASRTPAATLAGILADGYGAPLGPDAWEVTVAELQEEAELAALGSPERWFWATALQAAKDCRATGKDSIRNLPQRVPQQKRG